MTAIQGRIPKISSVAAIATLALVLTSVFAFAAPMQQAYPQVPTFEPVIDLTESIAKGAFYNYQTIASGNNVYAVWQDDTNGSKEIFFKRSINNGAIFGSVVNLSNNNGDSTYPQIAVSGSNVYVAWVDQSTGNKEIFLSKSNDNGATFSTAVNLSNNSGDSEFPQISVSGSNVYVMWRDNTAGNYDIFFTRSTDNGASFGNAVNLSRNNGNSMTGYREIQITASVNNVYIVWQDDTPGNLDIFFTRSTDNGASFSDVVNLSNNSGFSHHPQIAVSDNAVYVVWFDDTPAGGTGANADIFFTRSTDNGASFGNAVNLTNHIGDINGGGLQVAASGSNVYLTWSYGVAPNLDIFFTRSTDNGASFDPIINLSNNAGMSFNPNIAVSGNNVYVVWQDSNLGNDEIFLKRSANSGATFSEEINLSRNSADSGGPQIAASDNHIHVVWLDNTPKNSGLFFRAGTIAV